MFYSLLYRFFPDTIPIPKLINIICSTTTAYLAFRIYEESGGSDRNSYGILILSAFFPPMLLMNNLVYNDIIATMLFIASVLQVMIFSKTGKWLHLIPAILLLTAGNFIRQVGVLFLIAAVLFLVIRKIPGRLSL